MIDVEIDLFIDFLNLLKKKLRCVKNRFVLGNNFDPLTMFDANSYFELLIKVNIVTHHQLKN